MRAVIAVGALLGAAAGALSAAGCRAGSVAADPAGTWTLTRIVGDDDSVRTPPPTATVTYAIDTAKHTIESRWCLRGWSTPYETTTFAYEVTPAGTWAIANPGPQNRSIEFSVDCTDTTLTLTRVAASGPGTAIPPASVFRGSTAPASPGTEGPPKAFVLSR